MSTSTADVARRGPLPARHDDLVLAVIAEHSASLLGVARRYSYCADDAHDAYQRGLEIFLCKAGAVDPASAVGWLRTVIKHEALAVRAARRRVVGPGDVDMDLQEALDVSPADERVVAFERLERSAEALRGLKPQEVRALVLKARGYSYSEICEITGWTYTKVNRCLTEGRRAFHERFAEIEAGRECERWRGVLSAVADGEAPREDVMAVRSHLRACAGCRATLRSFRQAPGSVAAVVPIAAVTAAAGGGDGHGLLLRLYESLAGGLHERATHSAQRLQAGIEAASSGKVAVVAASATAIAGGGAAVTHGPLGAPRGAEPAVKRVHPVRATAAVPAGLASSRSATGTTAREHRRPRSSRSGGRRSARSPERRDASPSSPPASTEFAVEGTDVQPDAASTSVASAPSDGTGTASASSSPSASTTAAATSDQFEFGP